MEIARFSADQLPHMRRMFREYLQEFDPHAAPEDYFDEQRLVELLQGGRLTAFLAWDGAQAVGFVLVQLLVRWYRESSRTGVIEEMYVAAPYRRHGIGSALASQAIQELRGQGATNISAPVLRINTLGLLFWQRLGFTIEAYDLYLLN